MKNGRSPFKFLDSFTLADRNVFFGRDKEVEELYKLVFKTPLLLIYGLSGTGKTSLIQCGLASKFDGPDWLPIWVRRQANINDSLQAAIKNVTPVALQNATDPSPPKGVLWTKESLRTVSDQIEALYTHYLRPVFLIFDQFEELFILGKEAEQKTFVAQLKDILHNELPCTIILSVREEYLGSLYAFEKEIPSLFDFRMRVEPMDNANVKMVLSESFRQFNIKVEAPNEARYNEIIENVSRGKSGIELPYLQVYLDRLYREDYKRTYPNQAETGAWLPLEFTKNEITAFGTIDNVLDKFLEEQQTTIQKDLTAQDPSVTDGSVRGVLNGFVTDEGTKRPVRYKRLNNVVTIGEAEKTFFPNLKPTTLTACLMALESARLIRSDDNSIELAHDSLAALIDSKRTAEERRKNDIKRQIRLAYQTFPTTQEYMTRKQINAFEDVLPQLDLEATVVGFFNESRRIRMEEETVLLKREQKRLRILRGIAAAAVLGLMVAVGFYFNAQQAKTSAEKATKRAEEAQKDAVTQLNKFQVADSLRRKAEEKTEIEQFKILLDNIENGILPADKSCPDDDMLKQITDKAINQKNDLILVQKIQKYKPH